MTTDELVTDYDPADFARTTLLDRLEQAQAAFEESGYGLDAYQMALGWVVGHYNLRPEQAAKVDELFNDRLRERQEAREVVEADRAREVANAHRRLPGDSGGP